MPTNLLEGEVVVIGLSMSQYAKSTKVREKAYTNLIVPLNLAGLTPPNVSSPLASEVEVVGSKDIPTSFDAMRPSEKALSVTVGIVPPADVVSSRTVLNSLHKQI